MEKARARSNRHVSRGLVQDVTPHLLSKGWGYGAAPVSVGKVQTMRDNRIFCKHWSITLVLTSVRFPNTPRMPASSWLAGSDSHHDPIWPIWDPANSPAACCWSSSARAAAAGSLGSCWGMRAGLQSLFLGRAACAGCSALPCFSGIWGLLALQMIWGAVSLRFVTPSAQLLQTSSADSIQPVEPMERERMRSASKNTRGPRWEVLQKAWFRVCKLCLSSSFWELASRIQELIVLLPRAAGMVPATALGWAPAPICAGGASVPSLPAQGGFSTFSLWEGAVTSPEKPSCYHPLWLYVWSDFSCKERNSGDLGA